MWLTGQSRRRGEGASGVCVIATDRNSSVQCRQCEDTASTVSTNNERLIIESTPRPAVLAAATADAGDDDDGHCKRRSNSCQCPVTDDKEEEEEQKRHLI